MDRACITYEERNDYEILAGKYHRNKPFETKGTDGMISTCISEKKTVMFCTGMN
jgi:predicted sulfurtransferase